MASMRWDVILASAGAAVLLAGSGCATTHYAGDNDAARALLGPSFAWARVELDEGRIARPSSVPAGQTTFQVVNVGARDHSILIAGEGILEQLATALKPGEVVNFTIDLKPGSYVVMDPLDREGGGVWDRLLTASSREPSDR